MLGLLYATAAVDDSSASGSAAAAPGDIKIHSRAVGYACVVAIYVFVRHRRLPSVPLGRPSVCSLAGCGTQTVCFAYSWGPCVWCLCSEIFPTAQRAKGVSITTTTNWTFGIVISLFVPVLQVREQTPPASPVPFNGARMPCAGRLGVRALPHLRGLLRGHGGLHRRVCAGDEGGQH